MGRDARRQAASPGHLRPVRGRPRPRRQPDSAERSQGRHDRRPLYRPRAAPPQRSCRRPLQGRRRNSGVSLHVAARPAARRRAREAAAASRADASRHLPPRRRRARTRRECGRQGAAEVIGLAEIAGPIACLGPALYLYGTGISLEWRVAIHMAAIDLLAFYIPLTILAVSIARLPWQPSRVRILYCELVAMALVFVVVGFYQYETRNIFQNSKLQI